MNNIALCDRRPRYRRQGVLLPWPGCPPGSHGPWAMGHGQDARPSPAPLDGEEIGHQRCTLHHYWGQGRRLGARPLGS